MSVAESWDKRESNLKKRGHLLTAAELKRRGITRYDAEMLLSQGFCLPEPKTAASSPVGSKNRLKSSTPKRFSPRTQSKVSPSVSKSIQSSPTLAGALRKSAAKRTVFVRRNRKRQVSRPLRCRTARHRLRFTGSCKARKSVARAGNNARTRRTAKQLVDRDQMDFGDNEDDSSSESSSGSSEYCGRKVKVDVALSMSCEAVQSDSSPWMVRSPTCADTVLTPSKLRTRPRYLPTAAQSTDDCMPLLKKESTVSDETSTPSLVSQTKLKSSDRAHGDDMPVLEKEQEEDPSPFGPDSSVDSGWTSSADKRQSASSLAYRCRRHVDITDRRYGYDTREWRVPKLTIRRRRASGQSAGNSSGLVSSTSLLSSSGLIYEILPTACGHGSVESQPPSDDSSYSDRKSTTAASSPDSISPSCFYGGGSAGRALKRLRLKFGEESVAIDVGPS